MKSKTYTPEFRAEAVKLVLAQGLTLEEAAQRLDIPKGTLGTWLTLQSEAMILGLLPVVAAWRSLKRKWLGCAKNWPLNAWRRKC